jgi:hypothetical protein
MGIWWANRGGRATVVVAFALALGTLLYHAVALAQSAPAAPSDAVITNCANDAQLRMALQVVGPSTITFNCGAGAQTMRAALAAGGVATVAYADVDAHTAEQRCCQRHSRRGV